MKVIFIIIIFILIAILYSCYSCKEDQFISESMTNISSEETKIIESIKRIYDIDILAIRKLSDMATKIQTSGATINGNLYVSGNLNVVGDFILSGPTNLVPKGIIVAWGSDIIPEGWAICDGTNDTPDLRGKFVLSSGQQLLNTSGGTTTTMLSIENIPPHNHTLSSTSIDKVLNPQAQTCVYNDGESGGKNAYYYETNGWTGVFYSLTTIQQEFNSAYATTIVNRNTQLPISIMPPYYVLIYIIKI